MRYHKPRVIKTWDSFIDNLYGKPIYINWIKNGDMKSLNMCLDLMFQPFEKCIARI